MVGDGVKPRFQPIGQGFILFLSAHKQRSHRTGLVLILPREFHALHDEYFVTFLTGTVFKYR
jgi:hypothetical protein